jgi:hypothetical protein
MHPVYMPKIHSFIIFLKAYLPLPAHLLQPMMQVKKRGYKLEKKENG